MILIVKPAFALPLAAALLAALAGCGQTGPLYLPNPPKTTPAATTPPEQSQPVQTQPPTGAAPYSSSPVPSQQ